MVRKITKKRQKRAIIIYLCTKVHRREIESDGSHLNPERRTHTSAKRIAARRDSLILRKKTRFLPKSRYLCLIVSERVRARSPTTQNLHDMEYANHLNEYAAAPSAEDVAREVAALREAAAANNNADVFRFCYSAIDLTTLSCNDSAASVSAFAERCMEFYSAYPDIPNVASICIYPPFVETVGLAVDGSPMRITAVAGGFPSSQTFLEVKMLEVAMAIENGADEIDIVLNAGKMLSGEYDEAANEVEVLRAEAAGTVLKVILETGALKTPELIRKASLLSMFAGADFIKTSTGKIDVAATPEAAVVMCHAIRDYFERTGRRVGFKAAGGVRTAADAALYYTIVEKILGPGWLTTDLFRIGASSAANNLLSAIEGREVKFY